MRYIEKQFDAPAVLTHEANLVSCKLDEASLLSPDNLYPNYTGAQLYELVRDMETIPDLKKQLFEDQGGICCYCGMKLEYSFDPQYRVEHVRPKETCRELVGEYKNLLLSCKATKEEIDARNKAPKKKRKDMMHCDEAKGPAEIMYSPLNPDCEKAYIYNLQGVVKGLNENAKMDIETLGLDCAYLKRRRKEALDVLYDDDELLPEELLRAYKEKVLIRDEDNKLSEFCFVIANVIEQIIS